MRPELLAEFHHAKGIVERVHASLGLRKRYRLRDFLEDLDLMRSSARRKRALRRQEAARIAEFDGKDSVQTED